MKKSLIALAVAGALTAPMVAQADATLYGISEVRLNMTEDEDADVRVSKMRLGVKGDVAFENVEGASGFYGMEWEFNANANGTGAQGLEGASSSVANEVTVRKAFAGVKTGFGTFIGGRQNNPVDATEVTDIFTDASNGHALNNPDRLGNSLAYVTPSFNGVEAYAAMVLDGADTDAEEDVDGYVLGATYRGNGLTVAAGYWSFDENYIDGTAVTTGTAERDFWSLGASYSFGDATVMANYQDRETGSEDIEAYSIAATYAIGNATLKAGYYDSEVDDAGTASDVDSKTFALNATYALGKKASAYVEWSNTDIDRGVGAATADSDKDTWVVGYALSF